MSSIWSGADVLTGVIAAFTAAGGFSVGRRTASRDAIDVASETVDMLKTQIEILDNDKNNKDLIIIDLRTRVEVLEGLVTQRAEVEELNNKVSLVKETVDRIADKVGA